MNRWTHGYSMYHSSITLCGEIKGNSNTDPALLPSDSCGKWMLNNHFTPALHVGTFIQHDWHFGLFYGCMLYEFVMLLTCCILSWVGCGQMRHCHWSDSMQYLFIGEEVWRGTGLVPWVGGPLGAFLGFIWEKHSRARPAQKRYYTMRVIRHDRLQELMNSLNW